MENSLIDELSSNHTIREEDVEQTLLGGGDGGKIRDDAYNKELLTNLYYYYESGGWVSVCWRQIFLILVSLVQIGFGVFILFMFDWWSLIHCKEDCGDLISYITISLNYKLTIYLVVCSVFLIGLIYRSSRTLKKMLIIHRHCEQYIDSSISIANLKWDEFTNYLNLPLSSHEIASWIMQHDNFIIALINNNLIPTTIHNIPVFNSVLEGLFRYCYLNIESIAWHTDGKLARRFRKVGIIYLLLLPIMLPIMITYYISKNVDLFYLQKSFLGSRSYPLDRKWFLRQYNELPHFMKRRLAKSEIYADEYLTQFRDKTMDRVGRFIQIISGSAIFFIVLITAFDDSLLTEFTILDRTLLWHLALWSTLSTVGRGLIIHSHDAPNLSEILCRWGEYSHHLPDDWYEIPSSTHCRNGLSRLYPYTITVVLYEIIGCIAAPYFLIFAWPKASGEIIKFVQNNSEHVPSLGVVCSLSNFNLEKYGSSFYGPVDGVDREYSHNGKLEKSLITFGMNYNDTKDKVLTIFPTTNKNGEINMRTYLGDLLTNR
jgi:hypothetical protein